MKSEGSNQGLEKAITNTKKTNNKNNVTNISRPRPVRFHPKSILITRSNNPLVSRKKSEEEEQIQQPSSAIENKAEKDDDNVKTRRPKIPDYLALILNLIWFPFDCIIKVYRGVCFVISLPGKVLDWVKYLASRPAVLAKKAVEFIRQSQTQVFQWLLNNLEGFFYLCIDYHIGALCLLAFVFWLCPLPIMTYPLFSLLRLLLGTLYPAYASYKAVRTKNVREYVKWMMYWIVFALFTSIETFTDIFVAFWFPFYYEVKILFLIWLISPVSKGSLGSSILYRRFVHPTLINREEEIDQMILKLQEQGYNTVTKLAVKAFNNVSNIVMQTAIRGGGGLVHQLRKSYSLTDLNSDEPDYGADLREITNDTDEIRELERRRRTGSTGRTNTSGQVRYVRHVSSPDSDHDTNTQMRRRQTSPRSRDSSSPTMVRYRDHTAAKRRPGRESYPGNSTNSSRTLPRPKSLVFDPSKDQEIRRYKSVVTLKSSDESTSPTRVGTHLSSGYHRNYNNMSKSVKKSTSPTHKAVMRRRLSSSEATFGLTSEYFSYSSEEDQ